MKTAAEWLYPHQTVANNLNDLYKENPEAFYKVLEEWKKEELSKECGWIIKHASRNVSKKDSQAIFFAFHLDTSDKKL